MSLRALVQDAVLAGYGALGDIPEAVVYSSKAQTVVNPTTGKVTRPAFNYSVSLVLVKYHRHEVDGEMIKPEDVKGLLPAKGLDFEPQIGDAIKRNGEVFSVTRMGVDPTQSLYILQLRKP